MSFNDKFIDSVMIFIEYTKEKNGLEPRKKEIYKGIYPSKVITKIRNIYNKGELKEDGSIHLDGLILTKEMLDELNKVNFNFNRKTSDEIFYHNLNLLKEYLKKRSMSSITASTIYKNFNLGEWVHYLRIIKKYGTTNSNGDIQYFYNDSRCTLKKYQIEELDKIGFAWNRNSFEISTRGDYLDRRRTLHIKLHYVLQASKNQIKTKQDVEDINKKLMKTLD